MPFSVVWKRIKDEGQVQVQVKRAEILRLFQKIKKSKNVLTYQRSTAVESRSSSISHWCLLSAGGLAAVAVAAVVAAGPAWLQVSTDLDSRRLERERDEKKETRNTNYGARSWNLEIGDPPL